MSAPQLKVLISGSGIAGPCLAFWLSKTRLDVSIKIIERSPIPRVAGQAVDIRGSAIDIIKMMNIEQKIKAQHTTEKGTVFINSAGKTFAKFDAGPGESFTAEYEILRADLGGLFTEAIEGIDVVKTVYGESIKGIEQIDQGVKVSFTKGDPETFDVVIAADGSTSTTRPLFMDESILKDSYKFLGQYIAFFSIPSRPSDPKLWQIYNADKGRCLMLRPHRNPATMGAYLCLTTPAREQRDPVIEEAMDKGAAEKRAVLRKYLHNTGWEAERLLDGMETADDFYMSRTALVRLPKWTNNRCALLGDAAYATFGVATSLAIEGAYMLAGELSKINSSKDVPDALERYEQVFRSEVVDMGDVPSIFPQLAMPQTGWGLTIRNALIWTVCKSSIYKIFQRPSASKNTRLPSYDWKDEASVV
jgi:2-polyprenyl-6-methoxyphenol hydroxylase-like FAD-dependent oxidoreductase